MTFIYKSFTPLVHSMCDVCFCRPSLDFKEPNLQLIDMGRGIDMTLFPRGTTFNTVVTTKDFQCIEMQTKRPWTYQVTLIRCVLINYHNTESKITSSFLYSPLHLIDTCTLFCTFLPNTLKLNYFINIKNGCTSFMKSG
jgi:hypothetical protein